MTKQPFTLLSSEYLPTLDITLETYIHERTGAMHYHFASTSPENVFMVALRTIPHDSTGVAHILEHTALCGSKNFPVRDPFFSMIRRSMQTFMNAFTSSDWTAYPFATENKQDFDNLLRVYLDAVFFPNLSELDFLQEGHRLEFDENNELVIKWVVYNEMKWVYGNVYSRIYEINKALVHGETTYHYDSGGAPQVIPRLTYEAFKAFHKKHYHPTNATFFTFWDISAVSHQEKFEALALRHFEEKWEKISVPDETRLLAPIRTVVCYPSSDTDTPNQFHIIASWLLGAAHNAKNMLEMNILYTYLLDHSGSPLYHALETLPFAATISPFTSFDDSGREITVTTGIVTDNADHAKEVETTIFETLNNVITTGFDTEILEGIIDRIDMSLRKQNISEPYGLSLFLQIIGAATHEESVREIADPNHILEEIRANIKNPDYFPQLLEDNFINNSHFVLLSAAPDTKSVEEEMLLEKKYTNTLLGKMTDEEKSSLRLRMKKFSEHQHTSWDINCLPKLSITDIPTIWKKVWGRQDISPVYTHYNASTNWVYYYRKFSSIYLKNIQEVILSSMVSGLVGDIGYKKYSYIEAQNRLSKKVQVTSNFHIFRPFNSPSLATYYEFGGRFLDRNTTDAVKLLGELEGNTRFDEIEQIRTIFDERILTLKTDLTTNWHKIAMLRASSGNTLLASINEELGGISLLTTLKEFVKQSDTEITNSFENIFETIQKNSARVLTIGNEEFLHESLNTLHAPEESEYNYSEAFEKKIINEAWITDLPISYCALAIPTIPSEHEDSAYLSLLGKFLWDNYLHAAIREKWWAYGSGAWYDNISECFRFFSYRDPRIEGTFEDFKASIDWILTTELSEEKLDEAKMGLIAGVDTPNTPAQDALWDFLKKSLKNIPDGYEDSIRKKILSATTTDLKRVAKTYLSDLSHASRVVITGKQNEAILKKMGLEVQILD